jgi:tRNA/rRNA methyltransferase
VSLDRCRVVLVRPHYPANVGSVARAMRNLGFADLRIVEPATFHLDADARRLSTHGEPVLHAATRHPDLGDAVADCVRVVATSALTAGQYRDPTPAGPDVQIPLLADALTTGPAALVFGPEPNGLANVEVARCDALLTLPTDAEYPALNLAQSAAISLYLLRAEWLRRRPTPAPPADPADLPAAHADAERAFGRLREALEAVHFLYGDRADALMHALRQLLTRARPTAREVRILHGLARQLLWFAGQQGPPPALPPG